MEHKAGENITDKALIEGFLDGESTHFNVLYERYRRQLYSYLNRMLPGQHALVDDIFQQTWIKAIHSLNKYQSRQRFLAWIIRISHNQAIDHIRKRKKIDDSEAIEDRNDELLRIDGEPWKEMDREALSEALQWALEQIGPELKEVFLLRQDELSFKEIAEIQKASINTVLGRMQYALKNLRKLLEEWKKGNL